LNIDELNIKISSNTQSAKTGVEKLTTALDSLSKIDTSNINTLVSSLGELTKALNTGSRSSGSKSVTKKASDDTKELKFSVETSTKKIAELKAKLQELSNQGLGKGDTEFDNVFKQLTEAKLEFKEYKDSIKEAVKAEKELSKEPVKVSETQASKIQELVDKVIEKERQATAEIKNLSQDVAGAKPLKDDVASKNGTLKNYYKNDEALKQLKNDLKLTDEEYKQAFNSGNVRKGAKDWTDFQEKIKNAKEGLNETANAENNVSEKASRTLSPIEQVCDDLSHLKAYLKDLENQGIGFGNADYDGAYQEVKRLEQALKEYKKSLTDSGETGKQAFNKVKGSVTNTTPEIAQLQEKLKELSQQGLSFGDKEFDKTYASLQEANAKLKEYKSNLIKSAKPAKKVNKSLAPVKSSLKKLASLSGKFHKGFAKGAKSIIKNAKKALTNGVRPLSEGLKRIKNMFKNMLVRSVLYTAMSSVRDGFASLAKEDTKFNKSMSKMYSALMTLKNAFVSAFAPIIEVVEPYVTSFLNMLTNVVTKITEVIGALTGGKTVTIAKKQTLDYAEAMDESSSSTDSATKSNNAYKKSLAGFDEINQLTSNSSSDSSSSDDTTSNYTTQYITSGSSSLADLIKDSWADADFTGIGEIVSSKIVSALQGIDWTSIKEKAFKAGKSFATLINGLFEYTDKDGNTLATSIGKTIGESFNTIVNTVYGFVHNLKWGKVGSELASGLLKTIKTIDWGKAGETIHDFLVGLCDAIAGFFNKLSNGDEGYNTIKTAIVDFINGLDIFNITIHLLNAIFSIANFSFKFVGNIGKDLLKSLCNALGLEWDGSYINFGGALGVNIPNIKFNIGKDIGKDLLKSLCNALGLEWDGSYTYLNLGTSVVCVPNIKFNFGKKNKNGDSSNSKSEFWKSVKEFFGSTSPIVASLGTGTGTATVNSEFNASATNSLEELREWFNNKKNKVKILTATFKRSLGKGIEDFRNWFDNKKNETKTLKSNFTKWLGDKMQNWRDWFDNKANNSKSLTANFKSKIADALTRFIDTWNNLKDKAITLTASLFSKDNNGNSTSTSITSSIWDAFKNLLGFATGGFPTSGDLFYANEVTGSPEYIGSWGNKSAVANNDQIREGIASAVYDAIVSANGLGGQKQTNIANIKLEVDKDTLAKANYNFKTKKLRKGGANLAYV
jgi:hypothetical protein